MKKHFRLSVFLAAAILLLALSGCVLAEELPGDPATPTDLESGSPYGGLYQDTPTYAMEHFPQDQEAIGETDIGAVEVLDLETGYSLVRFDFDQDGSNYSIVMTGLRSDFAEIFRAPDGTAEHESGMRVLRMLAYNYLTGNGNGLMEELNDDAIRAGLDAHNLIDAEKLSAPDYDEFLCWAGSASDMLWMTGWASGQTDEDGNPLFTSEDDVFDYFRTCFTDAGSYQNMGIKFFINGVNILQDKESGEVVFPRTGDGMGAAQQKTREIGDILMYNGLVDDVAAENICDAYDMSSCTDFTEVFDDVALTAIDDGKAVGLCVAVYEPDTEGKLRQSNSHAVTLMGYLRGDNEADAGGLKGIFISDPDNNKDQEPADPAQRLNQYNYYDLATVDINGITSYMMREYGDGYVIDQFFTLKNRILSSYLKEPDDDGTMTPAGTPQEDGSCLLSPDLYPLSIYAVKDQKTVRTVEAGDSVTFYTDMMNMSYCSYPAEDRPEVKYTVLLYRDGSAEPCDILELTAGCDSEGLGAVSLLNFPCEYKFTETGNYLITVQIDGIVLHDRETGETVEIPEAYVSNNALQECCKLLVLPFPGGEDRQGGTEGDSEGDSSGDSQENDPRKTEPVRIFEAVFTGTAGEDWYIEFRCPDVTDEEGFIDLFKGDVRIDRENYKITRTDAGVFRIYFTEQFLRSLTGGTHRFRLTCGDAYVILKIRVI